MRRHRILPCWRIAMLAAMLLAGVVMPAPAHAASLTPDQQEEMTRLMVGLLTRHAPPGIVAEVVAEESICLSLGVFDCITDEILKKLGMTQRQFHEAWSIAGDWRVYDAYKARWGTINISSVFGPGQCIAVDCAYTGDDRVGGGCAPKLL
ncbi:MAG: hypothetical protein ACYDAR_18305 [Thermomicrobiales bacterium]